MKKMQNTVRVVNANAVIMEQSLCI